MSYFHPETWRAFNREETLAYTKSLQGRSGTQERSTDDGNKKNRNILVVQNLVSPVDAYTYLKARFGEPNGFQTFIRADDSDNIFHWDYYLKAGEKNLFFIGATQEVHIWVDDELSDLEWVRLLENFKKDFGRIGKQKRAVLAQLEKWSVFPNRFLSVASRCATSYESLRGALKALDDDFPSFSVNTDNPKFKNLARRQGALHGKITSAATDLSILTPVMFESFIGLFIACFVKKEVKKNTRLFESFIRSQLDVKIYDLYNRCEGFERPIDPNNLVMRRYWTAVNRRNDIIHGNIDPVRDALDTVYFDKKVPLFRSGGDRIKAFWDSLMLQYQPKTVLEDYVTAHEFIYEIINHLRPNMREMVFALISDTQPGFDEKRNKVGILFPHHVVNMYMEGLRYDHELEV